MPQESPELTPLQRQQQRRGRIMGTIICLTVLLPMVAAYGIFFTGIGVPGTTVNKGTLLDPPQAVQDLGLQELDSTPWDLADHRKQWRWLIPGDAHCSGHCRENLYLTRQVHIRLAEKSTRVERIYLLLDDHLDPDTETFLASEHPHIRVLKTDRATLQAVMTAAKLPGDAASDERYYLMDQEGFVMLSYTIAHKGQELLDDIKRMLKYSYEE
jgi:hypothetical protein